MNGALRVMRAMLAKDLARELRSREIFISSVLFSIILLAVIYFSASAGNVDYQRMTSGALWLCILFSGTIGLNRIHQSELVNGCYRALILYPVDGGWLYLAKYLANFILLITMMLLLLPIMVVFFNMGGPIRWLNFIASLVLGVSAFTAVGTLVVVITANTRIKDVLFPVIQLPLVVPVLIAGVNSSEMALLGQEPGNWLGMLVAINAVFISLGFLLFEFLLEE